MRYSAEKYLEYKRQWREKNRDKINAYSRQWLKNHYGYYKEWRKKHPGSWRKYPNLEEKIRNEWMKKIGERDGYKCRECGTTERLTLNHKIPRIIGGETSEDNLEILCLSCNIKEYHSLCRKALRYYFENFVSFK